MALKMLPRNPRSLGDINEYIDLCDPLTICEIRYGFNVKSDGHKTFFYARNTSIDL